MKKITEDEKQGKLSTNNLEQVNGGATFTNEAYGKAGIEKSRGTFGVSFWREGKKISKQAAHELTQTHIAMDWLKGSRENSDSDT
jgi:hypothetical protein